MDTPKVAASRKVVFFSVNTAVEKLFSSDNVRRAMASPLDLSVGKSNLPPPSGSPLRVGMPMENSKRSICR